MNREDIASKIDKIRETQRDYESAHGDEDSLRSEFIDFVAHEHWDEIELRKMAQLVLTTDDLDFPRHCA